MEIYTEYELEERAQCQKKNLKTANTAEKQPLPEKAKKEKSGLFAMVA